VLSNDESVLAEVTRSETPGLSAKAPAPLDMAPSIFEEASRCQTALLKPVSRSSNRSGDKTPMSDFAAAATAPCSHRVTLALKNAPP